MQHPPRIPVRKALMPFIDGAFVPAVAAGAYPDGASASRKAVLAAVASARRGLERWTVTEPIVRGKILVRTAGLLESRSSEFAALIAAARDLTDGVAAAEVAATIDRMVWYAGWCDKTLPFAADTPPASMPYVTQNRVRSAGVAGVVAPQRSSLIGFVSSILPALVAGCSVVVIASAEDPATALTFAELFATSGLPAGVCNILAGNRTASATRAMAGGGGADRMTVWGDGDESAFGSLPEAAMDGGIWVRTPREPEPGAWADGAWQSANDINAYVERTAIWQTAGY